MRISDEKIEQIRERTDIVEVVSSYLPLKRSGANHFGLCPFHSEKSPSFSVHGGRQIFHCFGCGEGGDVFAFVMKMEGLAFPEAARKLAQRAGIEIEEERPDPEQERRRREREQQLRIIEAAAAFYQQVLLRSPEGEPGRRYLKQRGFGADLAKAFRLGYAPERWDSLATHLAQSGFDPQAGRQIGLTREGKSGRGDYDLFRGRLVFPIFGSAGRVIAFGGRTLGSDRPKYLNSPESAIYHKGRTLYGFYQARDEMRRRGEVIVVEGYFDLLALHRAGFPHAVATCGTALTEEHVALLRRTAERVLLLFDQDAAGERATFRAMDLLLAAGVPGAVVLLEEGEDPDSFLARQGPEDFALRLQTARPALAYFMDRTLAVAGDSPPERARAIEEILGKVRQVRGDIERRLHLKALSERTGLEEELLARRLQEERRPPAPPPRPPAPPEQPAPPIPPAPGRKGIRQQEKDLKSQDWLLLLMTIDALWRRRVADEGIDNLFFDPDRKAVAEAILVLAERDIDGMLQSSGLTEEQKGILSGILERDKKELEENPEGVFEGCRKACERGKLRIRLRELQGLLEQTAAAGDWGRHADRQREFAEIKKRLQEI